MKIGELARETGIDVQTLRYYESLNLIDKPNRLPNGYRNYVPATLSTLGFIKKAKLVGFTLNEIRELLEIKVTKDEHTCQEVKEYTQMKLDEINHKIDELKKIKSALSAIHKTCCGGDDSAENCSILSALENNDD